MLAVELEYVGQLDKDEDVGIERKDAHVTRLPLELYDDLRVE